MATDIEQIQTALVEFNKVDAGLAQLKTNYAGVLYDVETPNGLELAKAARRVLREPRYAIEKIRKEAKAPILALGKRLDTEAARITGEIMKLEAPIQQQIETEESRQERERQAKIDAENARIAGITAKIEAIRAMPVRASGKPSVQVAAIQTEAAAIAIDASYAEFAEQAQAALAQTVAALAGLHGAAVAAEAEAARVVAERAELERLRTEQAERNRLEAERLAEENRKAAEAQAAEFARQQAEIAAQRRADAAAAEAERTRLAEIAREQELAAQAEWDRVVAERAEQEKAATLERERLAELNRQQQEAARAEDARIAAAREQLRKDQEALRAPPPAAVAAQTLPSVTPVARPSDEQIASVVAEYFHVLPEVACKWLADFGIGKAA